MSDTVTGTLELHENRGGFLRLPESDYCTRPDDVFVSPDLCGSLRLRGGETLVGAAKSSKSGTGKRRRTRLQLTKVESINGKSVDDHLDVTPFEELIAIDPERRIRFATPDGSASVQVIDLLTPIGFGQRGLICAPPRTGKTVLLQQMAAGLAHNHSDVYMMVLLIDERPEEVTQMRRSVHGEVVASSNDMDPESHVRIARLMIEKAKRKVEAGEDVVILLDSLTRLGRAFNAVVRGGGRIMSGGIDARALTEPKAIFGAARNAEGGASLTIVASALIDTGSRMDEVIFNEFKGTGNMEIMLTRELANIRIWPAIDLNESGTRKEEKLLTPDEHQAANYIRRTLHGHGAVRSMEMLLESLARYGDYEAFVAGQARKADSAHPRC